jgi:hypothetical protein
MADRTAARRKLSGAENRKRRVGRGLPARTEAEELYDQRRNKERAAANLAWITEHKLGQGCADCGYREHSAALDLDHLPGQEKVGILSRMLWHRREVVIREIAKCEVVCANCHRIRTYNRRRARYGPERDLL